MRELRIGLIGCGAIVEECHLPGLRSQGVTPTFSAVADPSAVRRDRIGDILRVPQGRRFADHRSLLDSVAGELNAVVIATPHQHHARQIIDAAQAGVNVICEKPMAISFEEADEALSEVRRAGIYFTVVHNLLRSPAMLAALRQIGDGHVGRPLFGRAQHFYRKPETLAPDDWRSETACGGGCLMDTGYHEIYSIEALVGSPVRRVQSLVRTLNYPIDADDLSLMLFEHESGAVSTVSAAWFAPSIGFDKGRWCEVHGTNGSIRVSHRCIDAFARITRGEETWQQLAVPGQDQDVNSVSDGRTDRWPSFYEIMQGGPSYADARQDPTGHGTFLGDALRAVEAGAPPPVSAEAARHQMAVIAAAQRASASRCGIDVEA